ncbi:calcofluor white hypersensitive protein [Umbelopsis sp. PMI_123]|nr:calcofluor white hypersensitive protein [Umbelopsis sp. PMI_123]
MPPSIHDQEENHHPFNNKGGTKVLFKFPARLISITHTIFAYCAFFLALIFGCYFSYYKIVQNEHYGYPEEWFPSVSATTGDRYPARAIFQIFIALTSGPRFALVFLWYLLITKSSRTSSAGFGKFLLTVGLTRTVSCGGWVYITSSDDHDTHDIAMILYLLCTLPWQIGVWKTTPRSSHTAAKWRKIFTSLFFATLPPMIYYFLQHKVHRVPGAYTKYAFFEWSLIIYDVAFDAVTALDFQRFEFAIQDLSAVHGHGDIDDDKHGERLDLHKSSKAWKRLQGYVGEIYLAFVFWSMLTSLGLLIWYFPLFNMGISGYEALLFVTLSPCLLGYRSVQVTVYKNRYLFHILSLTGVASYFIETPSRRLIVTAFGVSTCVLTWMATFIGSSADPVQFERNVLVWGTGLLFFNLVKLAWATESPIWPTMKASTGGWNGTGLILGIIAAVSGMLSNKKENQYMPRSLSSPLIRSPSNEGSWAYAAIGFGSVLFALHSMYTDSSLIMRWTVTGYPHYGPSPVPWGVLTIFVLAVGLVLSFNQQLALNTLWFVFGCASCLMFYGCSGWLGYFGGLLLGLYLMSLVIVLTRAMAGYSPMKTMLLAFMVYNILCLAHVWVVAYEFVPGGVYARERTNWVLSCTMAFIGLGVYNARIALQPNRPEKSPYRNLLQEVRSHIGILLAAIIAFSAIISVGRVITAGSIVPYHPDQKMFTAGIWTIHFALDNDMWASERRMRDAVRDLELDVIGFLESDTMRIIMGNRDWAQYIAEDLGYYIDYGPATMKHTWGCLMLSKFPIKKSVHHLLPSPIGELACAIHATLDVYGQDVDFIVSHNGQEENLLDRQQQTAELARIMRESENPFVFLGYVVTKPFQQIYQMLFDGGRMNDIEPSDDDRWCEYIGYRKLNRVGYARITHGGITDTEIQTGKFTLENGDLDQWKPSYEREAEANVPDKLRYPEMFKGEGIRNHHFHVLPNNEPIYYKPS